MKDFVKIDLIYYPKSGPGQGTEIYFKFCR